MVYSAINVTCLKRNVNETDVYLFFRKSPLILITRSLKNDVKFPHETELFKAETESKNMSLMASGLFEFLLIYFHNILFGTMCTDNLL